MFKHVVIFCVLLLGVSSQDYSPYQAVSNNYQYQSNLHSDQSSNIVKTPTQLRYFNQNEHQNSLPVSIPQYQNSDQQPISNQYQNSVVHNYNTDDKNLNNFLPVKPQPAPVQEQICDHVQKIPQSSYTTQSQYLQATNPPTPAQYNNQYHHQQPYQYQPEPVQNQEHPKPVFQSAAYQNNQYYQNANYEVRDQQQYSQVVHVQPERKSPLETQVRYQQQYENKENCNTGSEGLSAYKSDDYETNSQYQPNKLGNTATSYDAVSSHLQPPSNQQHQYYNDFQGVQS